MLGCSHRSFIPEGMKRMEWSTEPLFMPVSYTHLHRRLGRAVTVIQKSTILPRDDADARDVVRAALRTEGVALREGRTVVRLRKLGSGIEAVLDDGEAITASHLLVALSLIHI